MGRCEGAEVVNAEVGTRNAEQRGESLPPRDLRERTKVFALAIVRLVDALPRGRAADVIGRQLLRAGTSVAANYRSARRAAPGRSSSPRWGSWRKRATRARPGQGHDRQDRAGSVPPRARRDRGP